MRLTLYGLFGSPPMYTAMLALSGNPPPVGVNLTAIMHDELGDTTVRQRKSVQCADFAHTLSNRVPSHPDPRFLPTSASLAAYVVMGIDLQREA